ncbi:pentapeptide repeat-containing protein [Helicobacter sp.]|uniref:pentapeptide repeat-containing protein n=1 Tax=Helicobacter sp. TaxID=218 RepID=UPI0025B83862|nr:pentapeptide repeat-containing protein [Helicobacter sp.]MCI5967982.1 pentapeptide repeat-containing protein [Helicobacter sp.]MDY2585097.1 pentapeptide repeat-containing protein [Helicobacter sp.]
MKDESFAIDFYFKNCRFKNEIIFTNCFKNDISFEDCEFTGKIRFYLEKNTSNKEIHLQNVKFMRSKFKKEVIFSKGKVNRIKFGTCTFEKEVYFDECEFIESSSFYACRFEKIANFHRANFKEAPNFSQSIFKENINLLNVKFDFSFDNLETTIKNEKEREDREKSKEENQENEKSLSDFAADFKDSFRVLKNALIKENNLLEASKFHKYELYCQEIELRKFKNRQEKKKEENKKKNEKESENKDTMARKDTRKEIGGLKKDIDAWLLSFYRNLCEHHTDFLKIFNNFLVLIAFYASLNFLFIDVEYNEVFNTDNSKLYRIILSFLQNITESISSFIEEYRWILLVLVGLGLSLLALCVYTTKKGLKYLLKVLKYKIKLFLSLCVYTIKQGLKYFILKDKIELLLIFFVLIFLVVFILLIINILSVAILFCAFILFYFCLISLRTLCLRNLIVLASYLIVFWVIAIGKISLLNPLLGKLVNEEKMQDTWFVVLTFAYTYSYVFSAFLSSKNCKKELHSATLIKP